MAQVFAIIQLILEALRLWGVFLDWIDANHSKEMEERRQAREKAVDDQKGATSEDEFDKAQGDIVGNKP